MSAEKTALDRLKKALENTRNDLISLEEKIAEEVQRAQMEERSRDLASDMQIIGVRFAGVPTVYTYKYDDRRWNMFAQERDYVTVLSPRTDAWEIVQVVRVQNVTVPKHRFLKEAYPVQWRTPARTGTLMGYQGRL